VNTTYREMMDEAETIIEAWDMNEAICEPVRLAELVLALDGWVRKGGFLPDAWRKARQE
jgi:hypothetical protein